ncbi:BnaC08g08830D [Brassica napus]|uniref:BnaC08g08830D protein n=1 Tax=Brassica napus TaxID=3708 RepID=A0A078G254_BRANA|nr:BnaC08g08830D [Brassica napus]
MAIPNTTHVDNPSKERDSEEGFQRDPPSHSYLRVSTVVLRLKVENLE